MDNSRQRLVPLFRLDEVLGVMNHSQQQDSLLEAVTPGTVMVVHGPNFSGRTDLLRAFAGNNGGNEVDAYVPAEVYNSLSGLAGTVKEEMELQAQSAEHLAKALQLFSTLGLDRLYGRNPFTLSGGEQALLAVTTALILQPRHLSIDCALEQLDTDFRGATLHSIETARRAAVAILIADNRLTEYPAVSSAWLAANMPASSGNESGSLRLPPSLDPAISNRVNIALDGIAFKYPGGADVLRDVSIRLEPGTVYLLGGKNGSGKSTLAKLLCGVLRPTRGKIVFDNKEATPWKAPGQTVAYHFQNPDLQLFATSVEEELNLAAESGLLTRDSLLSLFGLHGLLKEHPLDLPFVIRKRVAMAATLAMPCSWVILDEPTLGQDQASIRTIAEVINLLSRNGLGVVIINHSEEFKSLLANSKALRLSNGSLSND